MLIRASDVPFYVENGFADLGITGADLVAESGAQVVRVASLPFGFCRLVLAAKANNGVSTAQDVDGKRIATCFSRLAGGFLRSRKISAQVISLGGAVEASIDAGVADAIIDITSTGATLRDNGLKEVECLFESSAVLISNPESSYSCASEIRRAAMLLGGGEK